MAFHATRNLYLTVQPSDSIDFDHERQTSPNDQLEELLKYESKANIFYDMDSLFISYQSLKREHTKLWKIRESFRTKITSHLNADPASKPAPIAPSTTDIARFTHSMDEVESNFAQWFYKLFDTACSTIEAQRAKDNLAQSLKHGHACSISIISEDEEIPTPTAYEMVKQKTAPTPPMPSPAMITMTKQKTAPIQKTNAYELELSKTYSNHSDTYENNIRPSQSKRKKCKKGKKKKKRKMSKVSSCSDVSYNIEPYSSPDSMNNSFQLKRLSSLLSLSTFSCISPSKSMSPRMSPFSSSNSFRRSFGELYDKDFVDCTAKHYAGRLEMIETSKKKTPFVYKASNKQFQMRQYYASQIYGNSETFESPFGTRSVLYCDWIGSGKSVQCIEEYLSTEMMALYAHTHDNSTISAMQSSAYEQEARSIILESVQGQSDQDVVLFCGNSAVDCVYKMATILQQSFVDSGNAYERDVFVVFVSIYESDNNVFIWKEMGCKVVVIPEYTAHSKKKGFDLEALETHLKFYSAPAQQEKHKLLIGSFTAANAITGIVLPVDDITELLHKYGALSFWDYGVGGPSMDILMTCWDNPEMSKDAIFVSTHRYLGGPGTPGILCAKKKLFQNVIPVVPGNGSLFVSYGHQHNEYEYLQNIEMREESGTPNLIGMVRASLCFMIKDYLSTQFIERLENAHFDYVISQLQSIPNLTILGDTEMDRLPILSMMITHEHCNKTKYLHHNYIAMLMNDLFGIQGRGGTFNCELYVMQCLGISEDERMKSMQRVKDHNELERRGVYRMNLHYTLNKEQLKYIVKAIKYVCKNGWRFLPLYEEDASTGSFHYRNRDSTSSKSIPTQLRSLLQISFDETTGEMLWNSKATRPQMNGKSSSSSSWLGNGAKYRREADQALKHLNQEFALFCAEKQLKNETNANQDSWYWLPSQFYPQIARI